MAVGGCGNFQAAKFCKVNYTQGAFVDLLFADIPTAVPFFPHYYLKLRIFLIVPVSGRHSRCQESQGLHLRMCPCPFMFSAGDGGTGKTLIKKKSDKKKTL